MISAEGVETALSALGATLEGRGLSYRIFVIGGSGLLLLGLISRPTADVDALGLVDESNFVIAGPLPVPLKAAIRDVGIAFDLAPDWLNDGPASLLDFGLPGAISKGLKYARSTPSKFICPTVST